MIMNWFNSFPGFVQGVIIIASLMTLLLVIQIVMLLIGLGDSDFDADFDGIDDDPFNDGGFLDIFGLKILTVRNVIGFLSIGGWTLVLIYEGTEILWLAIMLGVIAGLVTMFILSLAMKWLESMQSDGTTDINNCIGKKASVYLKIPANKEGFGKINVLIQDSYVEFDAVTEDTTEILTGSEVVVVEVINNYLVVRRV